MTFSTARLAIAVSEPRSAAAGTDREPEGRHHHDDPYPDDPDPAHFDPPTTPGRLRVRERFERPRAARKNRSMPPGSQGVAPPAIVRCEVCGTDQCVEADAGGFVCAACGDTFWFLDCPGCRKPAAWRAGYADRQAHLACGWLLKLPRRFSPPPVVPGEPITEVRPPWWRAADAGLPVRVERVDYVGGHTEHLRLERNVSVEFELEQVRVEIGVRSFTIPWLSVTALNVDGPAELAARVVVGRMARAGTLELGKVKAETTAYLVVETGPEALIFASTLAVAELAARCAGPLRALGDAVVEPRPSPPPPSPPSSSPDPATPSSGGSLTALLRELAALHAEGVLTDEEFATKKAEILRRL